MDAEPVEGPPPAEAPSGSPYVGLVPFGEGDSNLFFGRSRETAIIAANLRANRLTIVYGPSGVGKSSLLNAGVVHRLREEALAEGDHPTFPVCVYRDWPGDPVAGIREAIKAESGKDDGTTIADAVQAATDEQQRLLLVFDQFEEYFQYHPDEGGTTLTGFAAELTAVVNDTSVRAHVVLSVREDAWAKLDLLKGHIPALFNNYVRVDHLDVASATEAIEAPVYQVWNKTLPAGAQPYAIEPALTSAVLKQVAVGSLNLASDDGTPAPPEPTEGRIEAPFLQLVMDRLWHDMVENGGHTLTLARLGALGGAATIVKDHLLEALAQLTTPEKDIASDCFPFLVSSDRTKIARSAADIADGARRPVAEVSAVLDKLCTGESGRILRENAPASTGGSPTYELFHDILAEPILAWRRAYEVERRRRVLRRRIIRIGAIAVALIAVLAAFGAYAWVQRDQAISEKKAASTLAVASTATSLANGRLDESLLLDLAIGQTTPQARSAMIAGLEAARSSGLDAIVHSGSVAPMTALAFDGNSQTVATGDRDGMVEVWSLRRRVKLGPPLQTGCQVSAVALGGAGGTLATACYDGRVQLWDAASGATLGPPELACKAVWSLAFANGGNELAAGCYGGSVRLWRTGSGLGQPKTVKGHGGPVYALQPHAGHLLAAVVTTDQSGQDRVDVRDITATNDRHTNAHADCPLNISTDTVALSPNGKLLATGCFDGQVRLFSISTGKIVLLGPPLDVCDWVNALAFTADGRVLVAGCRNGTTHLLETTGSRLHSASTPLSSTSCDSVRSVAVSPDDKTLAVGCFDGTAQLWSLPIGSPGIRGVRLVDQGCVPNGPAALAVSRAILATVCQGGTRVQLWNTATGKLVHAIAPQAQQIFAVAISPDGRTFATGGYAPVHVWYRADRPRPPGSDAFLTDAIAYSPTGKELAVVGRDPNNGDAPEIQVLRVPTLKLYRGPLQIVYKACSGMEDVAIAPDGHSLAVACQDGNTMLWTTAGPSPREVTLRTAACDEAARVVFNPKGQTLATLCAGGTAVVWDVKTHQRLLAIPGGRGGAAIAYSPDGATIATGDDSGEVRLWDVATGTELGGALRAGSGTVSALAFTTNGGSLVTYDSGVIRVWRDILPSSTASARALACSFVWGRLTTDEWHQLAPGGFGYPASYC